jgi:hypothetical protein
MAARLLLLIGAGGMIRTTILATLLLASVPAVAAPTFTANFGGSSGNASSFDYNITTTLNQQLTLTASSRKFFIAPGSLTNLNQTTVTGQVSRSSIGIGIDGGGSAPQVDTNNAGTALNPLREALLITGSKKFAFQSLKLSFVDANDTLQIYGVNDDGTLANIGFGTTFNQTPGNPGTISGGLDGLAKNLTFNSANSGTYSFGIAPTTRFSSFLFTTRIGGDVTFGGDSGQGYRLDSITGALPEPGTWAMLIGGFGMAGAALRRQRKAVAA